MTTDLTASMRALQAEPTGPAAQNGQPGPRAYSITFTDDKTPKLVLPDVPAHDDLAGLAAWQTGVLQFDPNHPATGGVHEGSRGADGHAVILRAGAPPIRFEPASKANTARQLLPTLSWQLLPTDGEPYGFKDEHCRRIAHVLRLLCGVSTAPTVAQETAGIVRTFLSSAYADEGHTTHGTGGQRYEAAVALQHEPGAPPHYLVDANTGELVIRVGDLQAAARTHAGSSLPLGWLDARMENLGWRRCELDGHALPGRNGRSGPHVRAIVYRGHLPGDGEAVTT
jgi:hypothetical protein